MRLFSSRVACRHSLSRGVPRALLVEALEDRSLLSAGLVSDINPGTAGSNPAQLSDHAGTLLFGANGNRDVQGLWRSDGTEEGTARVNGSISSFVTDRMTFLNGLTYYTYNYVGVNPGPPPRFFFCTTLYQTDGTPEGTVSVFTPPCQPAPGPPAPSPRTLLTDFTIVGDTLFFAYPAAQQLYRITAGSPAVVVANVGSPAGLTNVGGTLFFSTTTQGQGRELWASDGTMQGTVRVKDINPGPDGSTPQSLVNVNGQLYFTADDGVHGRELWVSDGTEEGTRMVVDLNPLDSAFPHASVGFLTNINSVLVFSADDGQNGVELWVSYGTADTTYLVADIAPGPDGSWPAQFMELNGWVYFAALTVEHGYELWASDGTPEGTYLVRDINPGPDSSYPDKPVAFNGLLYFSAEEPGNGRELWVSDATWDGTLLAADIYPGATGSDPLWLTVVGNALFLAANDGVHGRELWKVDGGSGPSGGGGDAALIAALTATRKEQWTWPSLPLSFDKHNR